MKDTGERLIVEGNEQTLTYGEHLSRYLSVTNLAKNKVVLDVASGTGYGTHQLAQQAKKVTGLDYSKESILYAQKHYGAKNIDYIVGDAHELPLKDASVDMVVSFETIEHLSDPQKFVTEVKRVLKPGGLFAVSTPNDDEFMEGNEFHIHEFTLPEIEKIIKENFKYNQFYYQGTWFTAGLLSEDSFTKSEAILKEVVVAKTFKQDRKRAIFYIALASDRSLGSQTLEENIVVADRWSTKEDLEREQVRTGKLVNAEKENERLTLNLERATKELDHILDTKWWQARASAGRLKARLLGRN